MKMTLDDLDPPYLIIKPGLGEEDFYRLAGEDSDWEYLDGRIVMHSPASYRHEDLFRFLFITLGYFLSKRGGAVLMGSRYPMRLDPWWSPEPDLMVVREEHRHRMGKQRLEGPADLAIEIVSDADSHVVYKEKLPRYREAGVTEIWIVDPFRGEVLADSAAGAGRESRTAREGCIESTVIPGLWIDAGWLFREELPPPHECIEGILGYAKP
jgi:Uma2 family endonuclease